MFYIASNTSPCLQHVREAEDISSIVCWKESSHRKRVRFVSDGSGAAGPCIPSRCERENCVRCACTAATKLTEGRQRAAARCEDPTAAAASLLRSTTSDSIARVLRAESQEHWPSLQQRRDADTLATGGPECTLASDRLHYSSRVCNSCQSKCTSWTRFLVRYTHYLLVTYIPVVY